MPYCHNCNIEVPGQQMCQFGQPWPCFINPELDALVEEAKRKLAAMTDEEREAMYEKQKKGWVRAEMSWPRDCPYR